MTGKELAAKLTASGGALDSIRSENIDRIETNLQIAHAPKSAVRDFRTDYLMKVFKYDAASATFVESPLEDQIDRELLLKDDKLAREFKTWLLEPEHFAELDRGTVLIPEKFLAKSAIAPTPAGFVPSELMPAYGLVAGEGAKPVFTEDDIVGALRKPHKRGIALQNIRSVAGFVRRLNDVTCAGCHQTRGIGGFHFPGVDWMAAKPSNTTVVPASPHFFGDQLRRRDILAAFRDGKCRISPKASPAGRSSAAAPSLPAPNMRTAGARIAMCSARAPTRTTGAFVPGPAPKGSPAKPPRPRRGWACAL